MTKSDWQNEFESLIVFCLFFTYSSTSRNAADSSQAGRSYLRARFCESFNCGTERRTRQLRDAA